MPYVLFLPLIDDDYTSQCPTVTSGFIVLERVSVSILGCRFRERLGLEFRVVISFSFIHCCEIRKKTSGKGRSKC